MAQNFGSKRIVVGAHYGMRDWLSQRITATLMALFTVLVLPQAINALVMHRIAARGMETAAEPAANPDAAARKATLIARHGINVALPAARADANAR